MAYFWVSFRSEHLVGDDAVLSAEQVEFFAEQVLFPLGQCLQGALGDVAVASSPCQRRGGRGEGCGEYDETSKA